MRFLQFVLTRTWRGAAVPLLKVRLVTRTPSGGSHANWVRTASGPFLDPFTTPTAARGPGGPFRPSVVDWGLENSEFGDQQKNIEKTPMNHSIMGRILTQYFENRGHWNSFRCDIFRHAGEVGDVRWSRRNYEQRTFWRSPRNGKQFREDLDDNYFDPQLWI